MRLSVSRDLGSRRSMWERSERPVVTLTCHVILFLLELEESPRTHSSTSQDSNPKPLLNSQSLVSQCLRTAAGNQLLQEALPVLSAQHLYRASAALQVCASSWEG